MRRRSSLELSNHKAFGKSTIITRTFSLVLVPAPKEYRVLLFYLLRCLLSDVWLYIIWAKDTLMSISCTDTWVLKRWILSDRVIDTAERRALRRRILQLLLLLLHYSSTFHSLVMAHHIREITTSSIYWTARWALIFLLLFVFLEDLIAGLDALCSSVRFWKVICNSIFNYSAERVIARFRDGLVIVISLWFRVAYSDHLLEGSFVLAKAEAGAWDIRTLSAILDNIRYFNLAEVKFLFRRASGIYRHFIYLLKSLFDIIIYHSWRQGLHRTLFAWQSMN